MSRLNNRNTLIQKIHIGKTQLRMDELSYRTMLKAVTNKESCTKMTVPELVKVLSHLESKGFKVRSKKRTNSPSTATAKVNSNIAHKIRAVWIDMYKQGFLRDGTEQSLNHFVRKMVNKPGNTVLKLNVQSLNDQEACMVLERLKKWQWRLINDR